MSRHQTAHREWQLAFCRSHSPRLPARHDCIIWSAIFSGFARLVLSSALIAIPKRVVRTTPASTSTSTPFASSPAALLIKTSVLSLHNASRNFWARSLASSRRRQITDLYIPNAKLGCIAYLETHYRTCLKMVIGTEPSGRAGTFQESSSPFNS